MRISDLSSDLCSSYLPVFRSMAKRSESSRYMSNNTINSALRTLGYDTQEEITGHGFRATARTLIREYLGWDKDVIERHLAHVSDEELGGSYDRAVFLAQRRRMIQEWSDFLDDLAAGKEVVPVDAITPAAQPARHNVRHKPVQLPSQDKHRDGKERLLTS